ncbi:hypothetical protein V5O48_006602 [Marasmius crinis-equi]|uniref:Uncharacterized protein n=1 Tax=Marasmius crinis-equi TaxID=585013 RepID=A0ABR3FJA7_9AGAR
MRGILLIDMSPKKPSSGPHTDLEQRVEIPWDKTFRVGYGVNALTGESTTRCALSPFKDLSSNPKRKIAETKTTLDVIHWKDLKNLTDGYELEGGIGTGSFNVGLHPAVEFRAKLASVLSKSTSARTVLIQYRSAGEFEGEWLQDISIRPELVRGGMKEFREQYGDYYVAGYRRGYSCRAVIVCQVNEKGTSETFEAAAKAHVEKVITFGGSKDEGTTEARNCTLLHVVIDTRGCESPELISLGSMGDFRSVAKTIQSLAKSTRKAAGTPLVAVLNHYSTLHTTIPRRIEGIHSTVFTRAREMRELYTHLQAFLIHPALRTFEGDRTKINKALKTFEAARRTFLLQQLNKTKSDKEYEEIYKELKNLKDRSFTLDSRYEFIRSVKNMDRSIRKLPSGNSGTFRWVCGKTGGKVKEVAGGCQVVSFGPGYKAYEVTWTSPMTNVSKTELLFQKFGKTGAEQHVEFKVLPRADVPNPPEIPKSKKHGLFAVPYNDAEGSGSQERFTFQMVGSPVFIIGWTLLCEREGGSQNEPLIQLQDEQNCILSDHLSIRLDTSRPAKWTSQVTFVYQISYDFPDLNLKPGAGDGVLTQARGLVPPSV